MLLWSQVPGGTRDDAGALGAIEAYGSYREIRDDDGNLITKSAVGNPVGFTGRRHDLEAGTQLVYFRARYLDTLLGRFVSRDLMGAWHDAESMGNGQTYAGANPFNWVDPFGFGVFLPESQADEGHYASGWRGWLEMGRDLLGEMNRWSNPGVERVVRGSKIVGGTLIVIGGVKLALVPGIGTFVGPFVIVIGTGLIGEGLTGRDAPHREAAKAAFGGKAGEVVATGIEVVAGGVGAVNLGRGAAESTVDDFAQQMARQTSAALDDVARGAASTARAGASGVDDAARLADDAVCGVTGPASALPRPLPPGMTQAEFGSMMGWGTGNAAARSRIATLTRDELEAAGITREMAEAWRRFYRAVVCENPGNPSAAGRADLMERALQLLGGGG